MLALDATGRELLRRRVPTPAADYRATLSAVAALVRAAETELGGSGTVGIGTPGAISRLSGRIKNANSTCLNGQALKQDIEALLGREVRIANDANCFALSEAIDGAGCGARVVFGVILGTGVGAGVVVERQVLVGPNAIAGEWGHNPLPLPQGNDLPLPACYCGRRGCIETYLSGPGLAAQHLAVTGRSLTPPEICAAAEGGDARADSVLAQYEVRLARSLGQVINILDPDVIVLGGGLSNIERFYDSVPRLWSAYVFSDGVSTRFERNRHGDAGGVRGAAWLW
ncbi:MAG: ROK family protein [Betaproteobacteria bacterium]|nr:ROK family protein [Betaproteobacteria bacterium]